MRRAKTISATSLVVVLGVGALVGFLLVSAAPAGASLTGKCTARGVVTSGRKTITVDPKVVDKVTLPRKGDVHWRGATGVSAPRTATGEVRVAFPPPIGNRIVGEWGKNGKKISAPGNSGVYHYSLPALIAGIKIPVSGTHHEPGINCAGTVVVTIAGHSPLAWVALALTVVTVMNMALIMRGKRRVRP